MKRFYKIINWITEALPNSGARLIDLVVFLLVGNKLLSKTIQAWNLHLLKKVKKFEKICVITDVNVGDAVMNQSFISAIRDFFPSATIHYIIKKSALQLIDGNKKITHIWPVFTSAPFPSQDNVQEVTAILLENNFDVVFNFCPFLSSGKIKIPRRTIVIGFLGIVPLLVTAERNKTAKSHMMYSGYHFVYELLSSFLKPVGQSEFKGVSVTLCQDAVYLAKKILTDKYTKSENPKVFLNTDTSSRFTKIPFNIQKMLLEKLLDRPCDVLLGGGSLDDDYTTLLMDTLPLEKRNRVQIIPITTPLDVLAALIDHCEVFISGDTGPLHIAAARKFVKEGSFLFRNRTAVISIFGATSPRVYGYDSQGLGFLAANQDSISRVYAGRSKCRNITYINKNDIACSEDCFFYDIDVDEIINEIQFCITADINSVN